MDSVVLGMRLTPHGRLAVSLDSGAPSLEANLADRLRKAFERGSGSPQGLEQGDPGGALR
jgi:hypothetical protein